MTTRDTHAENTSVDSATLAPTPQVTPSQTVGPFFTDCLLRKDMRCYNVLVTPDTQGTRITISGHFYDGDKQPIPDAVLEIWQANAAGRYNHPADPSGLPIDPAFKGWGRSGTDADGAFSFETIKPGGVPFEGSMQSPHICLAVFARGLLNHIMTRIYFADEPGIDTDPVMTLVPEDRRATLLARRADDPASGSVVYNFNVILQGDGETVFFNL